MNIGFKIFSHLSIIFFFEILQKQKHSRKLKECNITENI